MIGIKRRKTPFSVCGKGTLKAAARGNGRAWTQANHTKAQDRGSARKVVLDYL